MTIGDLKRKLEEYPDHWGLEITVDGGFTAVSHARNYPVDYCLDFYIQNEVDDNGCDVTYVVLAIP